MRKLRSLFKEHVYLIVPNPLNRNALFLCQRARPGNRGQVVFHPYGYCFRHSREKQACLNMFQHQHHYY